MPKRFTMADVQDVMRFAKCTEEVARFALKATNGKFAEGVILAREETAIRSVPTGPAITMQSLSA